MKISEITLKHVNKKLYLYIYFENGKIKKFFVKDKYKNEIFCLLADITIFDKYK